MMLGFLQRLGKSFMLPVAALPVAGLLLRLGQEDLLDIPFIAAAGNAVFGHLALIFAIGIAVGFAKDNNGAAGLAGAIGYFVLTEGAKAINADNDMSVLGGILAGVIAGLIYNRFHETKLPDWLGFFGGRRFVPIMTSFVMIVLALIFGFVWPYVQDALDYFAKFIVDLGAIGTGLFGFFNRLLIPLGLHHVLNSFFWFVNGSYQSATGEVVSGDLWRFFAGDPSAGFFMAGFFPVMMFGLPAAAFAMVAAAKKEHRKAVGGLMVSVALTAFLTGITEPVEFAFMFLSPLLYVVHAVLTGISLAVAQLLDIHQGFTFSAGAFDFFLNLTKENTKHPWLLLGIGLIYAVIYFVVFYFLIVKLNLKTPGRTDDEEDSLGQEAGAEKYERLASEYLQALGGKENIASLDNCITRLRLGVNDMNRVDEDALKRLGSKGVIKLSQKELQVVVGTDVEFIAGDRKSVV